MGYENTTPIQEMAIPSILEGRDLIGCAQTGTGKTAAYLIPLLQLFHGEPSAVPRALIIVPTRELAEQIDQNLEALAYFTTVSSVAVYGGKNSDNWDKQKKALVGGADILIVTPGRMMSHMGLGYVNLSQVEVVVLDEADKMLDMGFYGDIIKLIKDIPTSRQTLLFSATMPPQIRKLAQEILKAEPVEINL
ncbi:MAG: DEAD/DEAH box helicase, partial [Bacteroidetes bacterium]